MQKQSNAGRFGVREAALVELLDAFIYIKKKTIKTSLLVFFESLLFPQ